MLTRFRNLSLLLPVLLLACSCAGSSGSATSTQYTESGNTAFRNYLVVGIADDYTNRAHFERQVVSLLRSEGVSATAYYIAAGGNKPVDRETLRAVVSDNEFDAVLVSRVIDTKSDVQLRSGSPDATASRRDGGPLALFRYDYEELQDPGSFDIRADARVAADLYRISDEALVWSTVISEKNASSVGALIDDVARALVRRVKRERLIGN